MLRGDQPVMVGHMEVRQGIMVPEQPKIFNNPEDEITILINARPVDFVNMKFSLFRAQLRLVNKSRDAGRWTDSSQSIPIFAFGATSVIQLVAIDIETKHLAETDWMNVYQGAITTLATFKHYFDEDTLMNQRNSDWAYTQYLHVEDTKNLDGALPHQVSKWLWVQLAFMMPLNDAGDIPLHNLRGRLRLTFRLSPEQRVWTMANFPRYVESSIPSDQATSDAGYTWSAADNWWTAESWTAPGLDSSHINWSRLGRSPAVDTSNWGWQMKNIGIVYHGTKSTEMGALSKDRMEFWCKEIVTMKQDLRGYENERICLEIRKSSVESVLVYFVDSQTTLPIIASPTSSGTFLRRPIDISTRAGRLGSTSYLAEGASADGELYYDPLIRQIDWYNVDVGTEVWPMPTGSGVSNPTDINENIQIMYRELKRYQQRNYIQGEVSQPQLRMHESSGHGMRRNALMETPQNEYLPTGEMTNNPDLHYAGNLQSLFAGDPDIYNVFFSGFDRSIYGGRTWQYEWWCNRDTNESTPPTSINECTFGYTRNYDFALKSRTGGTAPFTHGHWVLVTTEQIPLGNDVVDGQRLPGNFMIAQQFEIIGHKPTWIQGLDTDKFNININLHRPTPLDITRTQTYFNKAGSRITVNEAAPTALCFISCDSQWVLHDGTFDVEV